MIIDGKKIAEDILSRLSKDSEKCVAFVSFLKDPRSESFMNLKAMAGKELGIEVSVIEKEVASTEEAIDLVTELNPNYDGIVIQLPLPEGFAAQTIFNALSTEIDIDILSLETFERFQKKETSRLPPVAAAVWEVLMLNSVNLTNKKVVILGKGKLVGEPIAMFFEREGIVYKAFDRNSDSEEMHDALKTADIVITGLGKPNFLQPEMIKDSVVLIDCGTSESAGKLSGDIDPACATKTSLFTPVPGGIGPITVACLYRNLFLK